MSVSITIKLGPEEYSTLKRAVEDALQHAKDEYNVARDGGWHHNPDGKAIAARTLRLSDLLVKL